MGHGDTDSEAALRSNEGSSRGGLCVVLVEDHEVARRGLADMLNALPMVRDVHPVASTDAAQRLLLAGEQADVVLLTADEGEDEVSGLMSGAFVEASLLVLIRRSDPASLDRAARLPASGFLMEEDLTQDALGEALVSATKGRSPLPPALAKRLLAQARGRSGPGGGASLTAREHQVLELLIEGLSNKEIARRLGITQNCAKRHVGNVLAKLNAPNRTYAAVWTIRERL